MRLSDPYRPRQFVWGVENLEHPQSRGCCEVGRAAPCLWINWRAPWAAKEGVPCPKRMAVVRSELTLRVELYGLGNMINIQERGTHPRHTAPLNAGSDQPNGARGEEGVAGFRTLRDLMTADSEWPGASAKHEGMAIPPAVEGTAIIRGGLVVAVCWDEGVAPRRRLL